MASLLTEILTTISGRPPADEPRGGLGQLEQLGVAGMPGAGPEADWRGRMREIVIDLQDRGIVHPDQDAEALAVVWNAVALGDVFDIACEPACTREQGLQWGPAILERRSG